MHNFSLHFIKHLSYKHKCRLWISPSLKVTQNLHDIHTVSHTAAVSKHSRYNLSTVYSMDYTEMTHTKMNLT